MNWGALTFHCEWSRTQCEHVGLNVTATEMIREVCLLLMFGCLLDMELCFIELLNLEAWRKQFKKHKTSHQKLFLFSISSISINSIQHHNKEEIELLFQIVRFQQHKWHRKVGYTCCRTNCWNIKVKRNHLWWSWSKCSKMAETQTKTYKHNSLRLFNSCLK